MKTTFLLQACVAAMAAALSGCGDDTSSSGTTTTETTTGTGGTGGGVNTGGGGSGGATGGGGSSAGGGGGGGSAPCALGSTWTTVDDFQHSPGEPSNPVGIAALPPDRLFAVGIAKKGSFEWVVRRSDDGGSTWATIDAMAGGANGVTVDSLGRVYVVGGIGPNRVVRRSTDGGDSWEDVDSAPIGNGTCNTGFVTATSDGAVYAGWSCDTEGWTVRRSDDGGQTWTTADSYLYMAGTPSRLAGLGDGADGNALSGGYGTEPGGITRWIVRRGAAQGTWATDDDYQLAAGAAASVLGFGGATRPIAVGRANDAATVPHWIVRRFEGGTWSTLDDVAALDAAGTRAPAGAHEDGAGATYVVGAVADGAAPTAVLTRRSADGTSWSDVDTFSYAAGFPASPVSTMAHDGPGNLYAMVRGVAADGSAHWLVRKLACQ